MVQVLQLTFSERDMLADHPTSVVALPMTVHRVQLTRSHAIFCIKCRYTEVHFTWSLESGNVERLLETEPEILTFYVKPVCLVEETYAHIGVLQDPRFRSNVGINYRIAAVNSELYERYQPHLK